MVDPEGHLQQWQQEGKREQKLLLKQQIFSFGNHLPFTNHPSTIDVSNTELEFLPLDRVSGLRIFSRVTPNYLTIVNVDVDEVVVISFKFFIVANICDFLIPLVSPAATFVKLNGIIDNRFAEDAPVFAHLC